MRAYALTPAPLTATESQITELKSLLLSHDTQILIQAPTLEPMRHGNMAAIDYMTQPSQGPEFYMGMWVNRFKDLRGNT